MSLRLKWSLLFFVLAVAPIALLAPVAIGVQRRGLERAEMELESAVVDEAATATQAALEEAAAVTHRAGAVLIDPRIGDDDARLGLAGDVVAQSEVIDYVAVYGADGDYIDAIARKGRDSEAEPTKRVPNGGALDGWISRASDLLYVEKLERDREKRGYVAGRLVMARLVDALAKISQTRFERPDRIVLIDKSDDLRVLAAPGSPQLTGQSLRGRGLFKDLSGIGQGASILHEFLADDGTPMVGTVWNLGQAKQDWAVVVGRPRAEAYGALEASRRAFLGAAGAAAILALLLAAVSAARTTKPIRQLVDLSRAYGKREFARRSPVTSRDELGELGASMGEMADSLAASEVEIARRAAVEAGLARYLPAEVAKAVADGKKSLKLGGDRRIVGVMFADVASFTAFAERAQPEQVVAFLNELFTLLSEVVFRHGGMVDKFMGDCLMALFGTSADGDDDPAAPARAAAAAAEDMQRFVEASAPAWKEKYGVEVRLSIGVAAGEAIVGNLGSEVRMEFTAIGDTVNVASRLEGLARPGQTLVTKDVVDAAEGDFEFKSLGEHSIRGKKRAIEIYELSSDA